LTYKKYDVKLILVSDTRTSWKVILE